MLSQLQRLHNTDWRMSENDELGRMKEMDMAYFKDKICIT
jgi:hypothetical protein